MPIGSSDPALLSGVGNKMSSKYGSLISVSQNNSPNAAAFDKDVLFPTKMSVNALLGGIYFNGQTASGGNTIYTFTSIVNTKIPTSSIYLQTLAA